MAAPMLYAAINNYYSSKDKLLVSFLKEKLIAFTPEFSF